MRLGIGNGTVQPVGPDVLIRQLAVLPAERALSHELLCSMMADKHDAEPTQETQPKKGKPVKIPVPTREEFLRDLDKVAPPRRGGDS